MKRLTIEDANKLTTPRLLSYYKKYGNRWSSQFLEDEEFIWDIYDGKESEYLEYLELKNYWQSIKNILNKREHCSKNY